MEKLEDSLPRKLGLMTPVLGCFTEISQPVNNIIQDAIRIDTLEVSVRIMSVALCVKKVTISQVMRCVYDLLNRIFDDKHKTNMPTNIPKQSK